MVEAVVAVQEEGGNTAVHAVLAGVDLLEGEEGTSCCATDAGSLRTSFRHTADANPAAVDGLRRGNWGRAVADASRIAAGLG